MKDLFEHYPIASRVVTFVAISTFISILIAIQYRREERSRRKRS